MPKFFTRLLLVTTFLLTLFAAGRRPAYTQVTLKPNGRNAIPLRTKSMQAEVTIDRQIAATHLLLTFQNETQERIEADFIYTMPADSLVTSFAYWYGSEKVIARVVEKEEAASIYKHITTRMRDPALVEMIGKNTFRARIFPVMPNSDLKVEMNLIRALPSDEKGATYTFPLKAQKGDALDRITMKVDVKPDADVTGVTNDNGLPVKQDANGYHLSVLGTNYRPQKDLRVTLVRPPRPLIAELAAAPSTAKRDGFFALAVTPDRDLTNCKIAIDGVETYQLVSGNHTSVKAHRSLFLFGRYKGSGPAKAILSGTSAQGPVTLMHPVVFGADVQGNNPATKLWAARRMEQLSDNDSNREDVIALSKRFGMPSKYTSWLAVPKEEMARYEKEIAAAKIATVARQLAGEIADGHANSSKAKDLRAQYDHWRKVIGPNPEWAVSYSLSHDIENVSAKLAEQINAHKENSRNAREYREQLQLLCQVTGDNAAQQLESAFTSSLYTLANQIVQARYSENPNPKRADALLHQFHDLEHRIGKTSQDYITNAKKEWEQSTFSDLAWQLVEARHAKNVNAPRVAALTRKYRRLERTSGTSEQRYLDNAENTWQQNALTELARKIVDARHANNSQPKQADDLQREFQRLERKTGVSQQRLIQDAESYWKSVEESKVRDAMYKEHSKVRPDPRTVKRLEERFIELDTTGDYKESLELARTRAERIGIHAEQERNNRLIASAKQAGNTQLAELQRKQEELQKREDELRARQGDPLIRIDAPADAQQVIALLPNGEIKRLVYDGASKQWEARFDIPTYAAEGAYVIKIIVVRKEGTRQIQTLRYHVDLTPPTGTGRAQQVAGAQSMLRLELEGSDDTARVKALLPWGETVRLKPSGQAHRFFALTPVPIGQAAPHAITYILTDRAHNRTTITVDMEK